MTGLPANLASRQRRSVIADAAQGLGSSRGAHLSIRGGRFRLIDAAGNEKLLDTHYIDMIVIDANANPARVFFDGPYDPTSDAPPLCFSDNGTGPSTQSMEPQSPTCAVCPNNVRGSSTTFTGKPSTACDNRKKLAFIIPDDPAVNVYEFQVPPGSLTGLKDYSVWLGQQATGAQGRAMDIADVVTRVQFDPGRQFVMQFSAVAFADDDRTLQLIDYIDAEHLSDAAVGRNDVAHEPAAVKAMIEGRGQPALRGPAPAAPAPAAAPQQFTLPPRQAPAQIEAPAQSEPVAETPKKPRGRPAAAPAAAPAAPASAPFMAPAAAKAGPAPIAAVQDDGGIPSFLKRGESGQDPSTPPAPPAPRFGVGAAPPPPAGVIEALNAAMALPTRRG